MKLSKIIKYKNLFLLLVFLPFLKVYSLENNQMNVVVSNVSVPVYNVEVSWGTMEFTYNEIINYEWDNNTHTYELVPSNYKWISNGNDINIINRSAFSVNFILNYNSLNNNINGVFDISNSKLKTNESLTSKLTLDGKMNPNDSIYINVGTINLSIY